MAIIKDIESLTNQTISKWNNCLWGYAPDRAAKELSLVPFERIKTLTNEFAVIYRKIAKNTDLDITEGQMVSAYVLLGALTESWMFIFVKFYINDYNNKKYLNKKLKPLELSDLNFYKIIEYYESNIWDNQSRRMICVDGNPINVIDWLNKIRRYRNSIHIYKDKELGDKLELLEDTKVFYSIFKKITDALPEAQ